ncbi:Translocator protein homolog [Talaromyces islandicus]|uniref:Translocator protein homolog n=1 Tax=Talaromyces islandicus TaxID=28573 RepID=A0A0U1LS02_TALIS|nr:Translocator protein homolog [Talaromyces islandicus]
MASSFWSNLSLPTAVFTSPIAAIVTPAVAGAAVGYGTTKLFNTQKTYRSLRQPPGSPPGWLFGPVWTMLYGTMGYASYRATIAGLSSPSSLVRHLAHDSQGIYSVQLAANLVWMPLFFGLRKPVLALVDIVLQAGMAVGLVYNYHQIDDVAPWLVLPYLGWLGYASYLNFGVGYLNGWDISEEAVERRKKE